MFKSLIFHLKALARLEILTFEPDFEKRKALTLNEGRAYRILRAIKSNSLTGGSVEKF